MFDAQMIRSMHLLQIWIWFAGYYLGFVKSTTDIRKKFYHFFSFFEKEKIDSLLLSTYENRIRPQIRRALVDVARKLKEQNYVVVAVSGTLQQFCDFLKRDLNFDDAFGTRLLEQKKRYAGAWEGDILEGEFKSRFIENYAKEHDIDLRKSICYADSHTDIKAMKLFGEAVAVRPDAKLKKVAELNQWRIIDE